ncbi:MAG: UPF0262 family protein [Rhodobiaceae bacterium]|nr:UPF0262 family protein [Rhodobiaceae bacterium]MCC0015780.1 UPF0262 family protein [Rhodobiaceae bacterium]MCC0040565.1 UPF0262 family protein [Rhodobiaceae bacterium]MCC0054038.1 UPF0262 family protein [Rhodobiaceae bacterium]
MAGNKTGGEGAGRGARLVAVSLDEGSIRRSTPDIDHERAVAIYDLLEENHFQPAADAEGPFALNLSIQEQRLVMDISRSEGPAVATHVLSLTPLRKVIRDYFMICESYYEAIRQASPSRIEAIDMGRRGLHDEGSRILRERLEGKIDVDHDTARRLFTLICVLHWKG